MTLRSSNMLVGNGSLDQTGPATRADGYFGYAQGLHTVAFYVRNFVGWVYVDATVSDDPKESDWFPVGLSNTEHFDFEEPSTRVETFNIVGNFVYLRARIRRSHIGRPASELGNVERVVLSL